VSDDIVRHTMDTLCSHVTTSRALANPPTLVRTSRRADKEQDIQVVVHVQTTVNFPSRGRCCFGLPHCLSQWAPQGVTLGHRWHHRSGKEFYEDGSLRHP